MKGRDLMTIAQRVSDHHFPPMCQGGLVLTTILGHRRALRQLEEVPLDLLQSPMDRAMLEMISRQRRKRRWRWSTTVTRLAQLQGAMANLPLYCGLAPILLKDSPIWRMALKSATKRANEQIGMQPKAATEAAVLQVMENNNLPATIRAAILITWVTCARCGDTLKLRKMDMSFEETTGTLTVTWRRGKTVARRGAYTVHTVVPTKYRSLVLETLTTPTSATAKIFPNVIGRDLKLALRTVDRQLEQRSLRRGSLQLLASLGMEDSKLILFSGHTTIKMLHRYLGFGRLAKATANTMLAVAKIGFARA